MISALNCHRSRRVTSNYFLLLQCSPEQNGAADKSLNLLLIGSMKSKTESFGLFISFSRIHSMNYLHTVITFICLYISRAGEHSCLQGALVHAGYIYYLDFDSFFFGWRIAFINFVMISSMSYSSRISWIYWHLVTAWIQWKLLLFGTHSFFSCRFIRAFAYRWTIHWLLWLSIDKQEDIIIFCNCIYNKMLACVPLVHCTPVAR